MSKNPKGTQKLAKIPKFANIQCFIIPILMIPLASFFGVFWGMLSFWNEQLFLENTVFYTWEER